MKSVIRLITHPESKALYQARQDHAIVTGQEFVERPYWYADTTSDWLFHDLFACIGWPSEVSDKDVGMPGYAAIVGVIRPDTLDIKTHYNPVNAQFMLLREAEDFDVPSLLQKCLDLRDTYGFGLRPDMMTAFLGDPERFTTTLALLNERLIESKGDKNALLISPPDDFYTPKIFDVYVRSFQSCVLDGRERFFYGGNSILKNRVSEFRRDDPAVLAAGGLVHSLLNRIMWMDQRDNSTIFSAAEAA